VCPFPSEKENKRPATKTLRHENPRKRLMANKKLLTEAIRRSKHETLKRKTSMLSVLSVVKKFHQSQVVAVIKREEQSCIYQ